MTVINAPIHNRAAVALVDGEPRGAEVSGFTISGGGKAGILCDGATVRIRNNIITGNWSTADEYGGGIDLNNSFGSSIRSNIIHNNSAATYGGAISIEKNSFLDTVAYNVIYNNHGHGEIRCLDNVVGLQIYNNTISVGATTGITCHVNGTAYIRNNIIFDAADMAVRVSAGSVVAEYNCTFDNDSGSYNFTPGKGNIYENAEFVDRAGRNYELTRTSPCINAGHPDAAFVDPDGTRNDMGARPYWFELPYPLRLGPASEDSTHVVSHTPTFTWFFYDVGGTPTAYEIEVGTDADWETAEMWSSGEVLSPDTQAVYAGLPLVDGAAYYCRVRLNNGIRWGGWSDSRFWMNTAPSVPVPSWPTGESPANVAGVLLVADNSADAQLDPLVYDFEVYGDAALTVLVESRYGIPQETDQTTSGHIAGLAMGEQYWWRCRAFDGYEYSDWTAPETFVTRGSGLIRVPEDRATLQDAIDVGLDGDTVLVAAGEYYENIDFLGKAIVVTTAEGPGVTRLQPAVADQTTVSMVSGEGVGTEFSGFTVAGGAKGSTVRIANNARALITRNIFTGYAGDRVVIQCDVPDATIRYNLFYGNQGIGCVGIYSGSADIINNTFDNNRRGFFTISGAGIAKNNIVTNSTEFGISTSSGFTEVNYNNVWGNNPDYNGLAGGVSDISRDPLYADGPNRDYSLQSESPCIDAGDPGLGYLDPDATRNDMGAFPFDQELRLPLPVALNLGGELVSHVLNHQPTLYWTFYDTSGSQAAWEAEFGTDRDWTTAEMWDTGPVYSSDTSVAYAGAALADGVTYMYRLRVNNGAIWGDWVEASFHVNSAPEPPGPAWPIGQLPVKPVALRLRVANAVDTEMDYLTYDFEVYSDSFLTSVVFAEYGVAPQPDTTRSGIVGAVENDRQYWWRARASDSFEYSEWSPVESFVTRGTGIIYVPENFTRIKNAIAAAGNGDTVLVAPGIYTENLDFGGKTIVVTSARGPSVTTLSYANSYLNVLRIASGEGPGTEFSGFAVDGSNIPVVVNIGGGAQALIANNIFFGHSDSANPVVKCAGVHATVRGNLFYDNTGSSCIVGSAGTVDIVNNTFDGNGLAIGAMSGYRKATVKNNIVTHSSTYGIFTNSIFKELDYNDVWNNAQNYGGCAGGPNSISDDALFSDAAGHDYSLQETSPCIDAGDPSAQYLDLDGTRADMGAYPRLLDFPIATALNMGAEDSTHVMNHNPVIRWSYYDTLGAQTAYELEVGSDDDWSAAEMWAPGQVISADAFRTYAGAALMDGVDYWCRLRVSNGVLWGSWRQHRFHMNATPTIPDPFRPLTGTAVNALEVRLAVSNSSDSESDELSYDFRVYADPELTVVVVEQTGVAEQSGVTATDHIPDLDMGPNYWWLSRASDGFEYSNWSFPQRFSLRGPAVVEVPGEYPTIQGGIDAAGPFDTVRAGPGVYIENLEIDGKDVVVMSSDGPTQTVLKPQRDSAHTVYLGPSLGSGAELSGFTITGLTYAAFHIYTVFVGDNSSPLISRNIFYGNLSGAEIMVNSGAPRIINNTIIPAAFGIMASANSGAIVRNNIIAYSNFAGVSGTFKELDYNDFWGNGLEDYSGGATPGAHDISLDPLFADTAGHDYHLLPGSPVVNVGDPDPAYNDPDGSRNDMGALPEEVTRPIAAGLTIVDEEIQRVVNHSPIFAWSYVDEGGGQVRFEIEVGDDPYWRTADRWSSGIMESADTSVVYAGEWLRDGDEYLARVRVSDGVTWGSWRVMAFRMNAAPTTPTAKSPVASSVVHVNAVRLMVGNASDGDDDTRTYEFEIYADELLSQLVWSEVAVAEGVDSTTSSLVGGLGEDVSLWWRGRAFDGYEFSSWTDSIPFQTRGPGVIRVPGDAATIQAALDQAEKADTVLVAPGEYHENIDFSGKSIKLIGEGGAAQTALIPYDLFMPVVTIASGEGPETEFKGFDVSGASSLSSHNAVIEIDNGAAPTIRENVFHDNFLSLGFVGRVINCGTAAAVITDNVFFDNYGRVCVLLSEDAWKPLVANNTFDGNYGGIEVLGNAILVNNIITNSARAGITHSAPNMPQADYNCLYNNNPDYMYGEAAPHDIGVDPLYVSRESHDYSLQLLSPCIDAGHPGYEYVDPDGTRDDMGAIPFAQDNQPFAGFLNLGEEDLTRVAADAPVFYWTFMDGAQPGQAAYEVEVGTNDDWSVAEMWATGSVPSADTSAVYAGLAFEEGSEYFGRVRVNNGIDWGGWNKIAFRMNIRPTAPLLLRPVDLDTVPYEYVRFVAEPSVDGDGDGMAYDFEVYADESLSMLVAAVVGYVPWNEIKVTTDYVSGLAAEEQYWWRARASDAYEYSDWSEVRTFVTRAETVIHVPSSYATIAEAVAAAEDGFTIVVAPGVYQEYISIVSKQLIVRSSHGPEVTIIEPSVMATEILHLKGSPPGTEFSGFTIRGNVRGSLVNVTSGSQPLISGNIFTDCENEESVVRCQSSSPVIRNNVFRGNRASSCVFAFGGSPTILNNTFDSCPVAVLLGFTSGLFKNNVVTNCTEYGIVTDGYGGELDYNNVWNNSTDYSGQAPGPHDISKDPLYTGPDIGEYRLGIGSPCIDVGDPDPSFFDPDGTRNDMGAYPSGTAGYPSVCRLNVSPRYVDMFVASESPQISWSYFDTAEVTQAVYQVEIGTDDDWTEAEMWATGEVSSVDSSAAYSGAALEKHRAYFLRIRVNDGSTWGGWTSSAFLMHAPRVLQVPEDYMTIQSAMDAGWYGDTVLVKPGQYTECLQYSYHPLVVRSEKGPDSTFLTYPGEIYSLVLHGGGDSGSVFEGFTVSGVDSAGSLIYVLGSGSVVRVSNNKFVDNKATVAICAYADETVEVTRNLFVNAASEAVVYILEAACHFVNNTVVGGHEGILRAGYGSVIFNNIIAGLDGHAVSMLPRDCPLDYNDFWNNGYEDNPGENGISADPMFVDTAAGEFSLRAGSPCIDAGHPDAEYNDPDDSRNDIGAIPYEHGTGVDDDAAKPYTFSLSQNYPNPFNPATAIGYSIAVRSQVELTVYNILGQTVIPLVDGEQSAGNYTVIWDGTNRRGERVSSGVYFYRIKAGRFNDSRKMILLK
ncbi:MAG: right-handed parallel beta-helix repeat-containing protein [candidate division Zixibacteria bacterium]|nr:right-handed parallel beta-helix repeat-containing protein [candidate division Zixibacteria bacterium]